MEEVKSFPLVFTFPELIAGAGFVAVVELQGRATLVEESDGDIWIYGVQPGGVAGGGKDYAEACREFKKGCLSVLFDAAIGAETFEKFDEEVKGFFGAVNKSTQKQWEAALAEVRKSAKGHPAFGTVKAEERPPKLRIKKLEKQTTKPDLNRFDYVAKAA